MSSKYFEDLNVGDVFETPGRTVTEADVVAYAALSGDYNQLHTDEEFAKKTRWGTRIAHGMLGMTMLLGLSERLGLFDGTAIAFLGIDSWKFEGPFFPGDTIRAKVRVEEKTPSRSKPDRGVVKFFFQVVKEDESVIQSGYKTIMIRRKAG